MMINIFNFFRKNDIGNPPYDYYFLKNLDEKEYPLYLAKLFYLNTREKLLLKYDFKNKSWIIDKKKCKTFNQKIQWIKLYGITDLMRKCTDKVLVRDYVAEKIGEDYLKPVLQIIPSLNCDCHVIARNNSTLGDEAIQWKRSQKAVHENWEIKSNNELDCHVAIAPRNDETIKDFNMLSHSEPNVNSGVKNFYNISRVDFSQPKQDVTTYFDQSYWEKLPNSFVIKCNHGCKWQYIIKDKKAFLQNKQLFDIVKKNMTGWLQQDYSFWCGFELNYLNIEPKILIEPLMRDCINKGPVKINVYCFNGNPMIIIKFFDKNKMSIWDKTFKSLENIFGFMEENIKISIDKYIKQSIDLSVKLAQNFIFVRVDWMIYQNKLYFEELTFTPYSGMINFADINTGITLGRYIKLK